MKGSPGVRGRTVGPRGSRTHPGANRGARGTAGTHAPLARPSIPRYAVLDTLEAVERELPALLRDEGAWKSLFVDYHPPTVERLWRPCRVAANAALS